MAPRTPRLEISAAAEGTRRPLCGSRSGPGGAREEPGGPCAPRRARPTPHFAGRGAGPAGVLGRQAGQPLRPPCRPRPPGTLQKLCSHLID